MHLSFSAAHSAGSYRYQNNLIVQKVNNNNSTNHHIKLLFMSAIDDLIDLMYVKKLKESVFSEII